MALKAEGIWPCIVLSGSYGESADPRRAGITSVQINVQIDAGPDKGKCCTYEDDVNARSALYIARSCQNAGWKGGPKGDDLNTLAADIEAWIKETGGKALVEIKHIPIKTGKRAGEIWDKVNGIRRGARPLKAASDTALADARDAIRAAREADGTAESAEDNIPHAATGTNGAVGGVSDEEIPF
jgi:hypothetical protein